MVLQRTVEALLNQLPPHNRPSQKQMEDLKGAVAKELSKKYPEGGIEYQPEGK